MKDEARGRPVSGTSTSGRGARVSRARSPHTASSFTFTHYLTELQLKTIRALRGTVGRVLVEEDSAEVPLGWSVGLASKLIAG